VADPGGSGKPLCRLLQALCKLCLVVTTILPHFYQVLSQDDRT
jgi:hypothetical protein